MTTMVRRPVLLIHGIWDRKHVFEDLSAHLGGLGLDVHILELYPNLGIAPLDVLAEQVRDYVDRTFAPTQAIDLLGFSMGGIVTRYYLQRLGGRDRVRHYVSVSAPNQGTLLAYALPWAGVKQMRPDSALLGDLNRTVQEDLGDLRVTVLWTPLDGMILPQHSSRLPLGEEIQIPVAIHAWMLKDRRCLEVIGDRLLKTVGEKSAPQPMSKNTN